MRLFSRVIAPLIVFCLSATTRGWAQASSATSVEPRVEATGTGESRIAPDRATVILRVETKGQLAARVAAANAQIQQRVLDTLGILGFTGSRVSTVGYSVEPNYERTPSGSGFRQVGYVARNAVRVQLMELDRVGAVIDAALARGANSVDGVEFEASNMDTARATALTQAAQRARASAEALARSLHGRLGPLIEITDVTSDRLVYPARRMMRGVAPGFARGAPQTPITPADIVVEVSVIGRWQFVLAP